jgi:hypothetical protein
MISIHVSNIYNAEICATDINILWKPIYYMLSERRMDSLSVVGNVVLSNHAVRESVVVDDEVVKARARVKVEIITK